MSNVQKVNGTLVVNKRENYTSTTLPVSQQGFTSTTKVGQKGFRNTLFVP